MSSDTYTQYRIAVITKEINLIYTFNQIFESNQTSITLADHKLQPNKI